VHIDPDDLFMKTTVERYFPNLTALQKERFSLLENLYIEWNARINVISRKDMDQLMIHHVLHSLGIAKVINFKPGTAIMDAGTGGGFPGIPLAILFPEVHFTLVDSIGKKIKVVGNIAQSVGLNNITPLNARFETVRGAFDFVTGRAVTNLPQFFTWTRKKIKKTGFNDLTNGILYLTGGETELAEKKTDFRYTFYPLSEYFEDPWFSTKKLIHLYNCL